MHPAVNKLTSPGQRRPGIFRGGIIQIMITRSCDKSCYGCTSGSNFISKPGVMSVDQFDEALASLENYWGVTACFGGNPCSHPQFDKICERMRARVPFEQRGLWTNRLLGKGALARITFNPYHSNINVHGDAEAYAEFERDWPEALKARPAHTRDGLTQDSQHGTPYISMVDLGIPEEERWRLIADCDISKFWSAIITVVRGELRCFFCEVAGHFAALHADNPDWAGSGEKMPDVGLACQPGWWQKPMADFEQQVLTCCHNCAVPLRRPGQLANGGEHEEYSKTHAFVARPKVRDRPMQLVESIGTLSRPERPATNYLPGITPGYKGA